MEGYLVTRVAGTIPVDVNGEPLHTGVDSSYIIYLETNRQISWDSAWVDGKRFRVIANKLEDFPVKAGIKSDGEELHLTPRKGYTLWMLQLDTNESPITAPPPGNERLLIRGNYDNKSFIKGIDEIPVLTLANSV